MRLIESDIPVCALIVNRVRGDARDFETDLPETAWEAGFRPADGAGRDALVDSMWDRYLAWQQQCRSDDRSITELHGHCGWQLPLVRIPRLEVEVHDLEALSRIADLLSRS